MMHLFQIGREYTISIAEIMHVFPRSEIVFINRQVCVVGGLTNDQILKKANSIGGSIKIGEYLDETVIDAGRAYEGKFQYGVSIFGGRHTLKKYLMDTKKALKESGVSSRFVNKEFQNLSSSQILGEKLVSKGADFSIVTREHSTDVFRTIWVQDIYAYSKRDYAKSRDMQVGMLPPKLCQIMLNIAGGKSVYDPFVGLGTLLIESVYMGNIAVYGSDLSEVMVETSKNNLQELKKNKNFDFQIKKLNAKFIDESQYLKVSDSIVSEGYLGEVMTQKNISLDRIEKQRQSLEKLYEGFFSSLRKAKFTGKIVICFPFWEIGGKYQYCENIYDLLKKYCVIHHVIDLENIPVTYQDIIHINTLGSLLYKREKQLVGREIFKLMIK